MPKGNTEKKGNEHNCVSSLWSKSTDWINKEPYVKTKIEQCKPSSCNSSSQPEKIHPLDKEIKFANDIIKFLHLYGSSF